MNKLIIRFGLIIAVSFCVSAVAVSSPSVAFASCEIVSVDSRPTVSVGVRALSRVLYRDLNGGAISQIDATMFPSRAIATLRLEDQSVGVYIAGSNDPGIRFIGDDSLPRTIYSGATSGTHVISDSIAVDPQNRRIYFATADKGLVHSNLDGSDIKVIDASATTRVGAIRVDSRSGFLFYVIPGNSGELSTVIRSRLDGSDAKRLEWEQGALANSDVMSIRGACFGY